MLKLLILSKVESTGGGELTDTSVWPLIFQMLCKAKRMHDIPLI